MSKLGYFLGGVLAGIIGTTVAAYAVDACSTSSTSANLEHDTDEATICMEDNASDGAESSTQAEKQAPCTA